MNFRKTKDMENKKYEKKYENWKANGLKYLKELQAFLDKAENIENEEMRKEIIFQMLKCDNELTLLAEENFEKYKSERIKSIKEYEDD